MRTKIYGEPTFPPSKYPPLWIYLLVGLMAGLVLGSCVKPQKYQTDSVVISTQTFEMYQWGWDNLNCLYNTAEVEVRQHLKPTTLQAAVIYCVQEYPPPSPTAGDTTTQDVPE